jgi:hypothetical protein
VPVVFLIAIVAVLVAIFFAATGRGGEMAYEHADHAPLDLGPVSSADVALLRPPTALWGYNMQVTDAALDQIAQAMRDRDVTIAYLQEQLAGYQRNGTYAEPRGAHARQDQETAEATESGGPELQDTAEFEDTDEDPDIIPFAPAAEEPADVLESSEPRPPRTTLILRATGRGRPAEPQPHDPTQPSPVLPDDEEPHDPTHPSATTAPEEAPGPQGAFDTHGWWAEQKEAARQEQARHRPEPGQDDDLAAVEEQGW